MHLRSLANGIAQWSPTACSRDKLARESGWAKQKATTSWTGRKKNLYISSHDSLQRSTPLRSTNPFRTIAVFSSHFAPVSLPPTPWWKRPERDDWWKVGLQPIISGRARSFHVQCPGEWHKSFWATDSKSRCTKGNRKCHCHKHAETHVAQYTHCN